MPKPYRKSLLSFLLPRLAPEPAPREAPLSVPKYQGVSIRPGSKACGAVKQLNQRRFLAKSVPSLPLAGCGLSGQCHCRYVKHADRRSDAGRRSRVSTAAWPLCRRRRWDRDMAGLGELTSETLIAQRRACTFLRERLLTQL